MVKSVFTSRLAQKQLSKTWWKIQAAHFWGSYQYPGLVLNLRLADRGGLSKANPVAPLVHLKQKGSGCNNISIKSIYYPEYANIQNRTANDFALTTYSIHRIICNKMHQNAISTKNHRTTSVPICPTALPKTSSCPIPPCLHPARWARWRRWGRA